MPPARPFAGQGTVTKNRGKHRAQIMVGHGDPILGPSVIIKEARAHLRKLQAATSEADLRRIRNDLVAELEARKTAEAEVQQGQQLPGRIRRFCWSGSSSGCLLGAPSSIVSSWSSRA